MNGIPKEDIKLMGRWKSDAIDVYLNELNESDHTRKLLNLNSQLHNSPTSYLSGTSEFHGPTILMNSSHGL